MRNPNESHLPVPVCNAEPYARYPAGEYQVRAYGSRIYQDPRFRAWKLRIDFHFLTDNGTVSKFYHLGTGTKPIVGRGSEYRRAWVIATGRQPDKGEELSPGVFIGSIFKVTIGDNRKRHDGRDHPDAEIYSTVKEILGVVETFK